MKTLVGTKSLTPYCKRAHFTPAVAVEIYSRDYFFHFYFFAKILKVKRKQNNKLPPSAQWASPNPSALRASPQRGEKPSILKKKAKK